MLPITVRQSVVFLALRLVLLQILLSSLYLLVRFPFSLFNISFFQDFWGRIFNYGTITLFNPFLNQRIHLDAIGNPSKYVKIIEGALPDTNHSGNILFIDQENKNI